MKHTQGPWGLSNNATVDSAPTEWTIGTMKGRIIVAEGITNAQDARLIAAAPELLEVLERARYGLSNFLTQKEKLILVNDLENTIAKAKGE